MRIHSIAHAVAIAAYLSFPILVATALPTPFPSSIGSGGDSSCIVVANESMECIGRTNVSNEAHDVQVVGGARTTSDDEPEPRATRSKRPNIDRYTVRIPSSLRIDQLDIPESITAPSDRSKITPKERENVKEILQKIQVSIAGLDYKSKPKRDFQTLKNKVQGRLGYSPPPKIHFTRVPQFFQQNQPDIPKVITTPWDPSQITAKEQQQVYEMLEKMQESVAGLHSLDPRRKQVSNFKAALLNIGYTVDHTRWPAGGTKSSQTKVHPSSQSSSDPVAQPGPSDGPTSVVSPPPVHEPPSTPMGVHSVEFSRLPSINEMLSFPGFVPPEPSASSHSVDANGIPTSWGPKGAAY